MQDQLKIIPQIYLFSLSYILCLIFGKWLKNTTCLTDIYLAVFEVNE